MSLSDVSIRRPVLTWMMVMALAVFGVLGYLRLGVDQYPDMEFPQVTVTARMDGAAPEGMEEDVTDVLEEHLNTIAGIRTLRSTSYAGIARIAVEFELGVDLDTAIQDVRDQVSRARAHLPSAVEPPQVSRLRTGSFPILYVPFLSSRPAVEVTEWVEQNAKPLVETIPGVAGVPILGERERNIRIWLDPDALRARRLAANDVLLALRREHLEAPSGLVEGDAVEWTVKTEAEFRSIEALENMVVATRGEAPVRLRDVARVEDGVEDVRDLVRYNGEDSVVLGVLKQSDANTVAVVDEVRRRMDALRPLLPRDIELPPSKELVDFSLSIREAVEEAIFALVFGGLLAVFVVFVFLRRTRPTLIVAAAIPLSLIATFGLVWMFGYTLNTMTLLGMTLAIGVVIDDAIIVLENIERHRDQGEGGMEAASRGTREIVLAATAATFSIAAVFLPTVFAEGFVRSFLGEFGLTVAGAVIVSLFVALTLTPMLAARIPPPAAHQRGSLYQRLERAFASLEGGYRRVLHATLAHRFLTTVVALASFGLAIFFGTRLGAEFFPSSDGRIVYMQFETAPGSSLQATTEMMQRNEQYFLALPEKLAVFEGIGHTTETSVGRPNAGAIFVTLKHADDRQRTSLEIMKEARAVLGEIPGQKFTISDPSASMSVEGELQVQLRGNLAISELARYADVLARELRRREGFVDVDKNLEIGSPEVRVIPDRAKAAELGVDAATVAQVIQVMIGGLDVGVFKEHGGGRHDIRVRLDREHRDTPAAIGELAVRARDGQVVDLRNLVRLETGAAASAISRTNRQRSVKVSANLDGKALNQAIKETFAIARRILPDDVVPELVGRAEAMRESFEQFSMLLLLAILVTYMVLAAQFESFVLPSVMLALPFSMVGALGGLYAAGMTLNIFSLIGIVLLMGLVTKNSILLVDYANQLRDGGRNALEAMREAAPVRLRPVLMTALSMIFGVLPAALGIGPGSETRAPMAVATACGMFSSMLLTLLVVPVFYVGLSDLTDWCKGKVASALGR